MRKNSFTLITGVLLLIAVMMVSLIGLSMRFIGVSDSEMDSRFYNELHAAADACLEEGLIRFKRDALFVKISLSIGESFCTIKRDYISGTTHKLGVTANNSSGQMLRLEALMERATQQEAVNIRIISYNYL